MKVLSIMETEIITDRARALTPEEREITIRNLPSSTMLAELARRDRLIMETLNNFIDTWNSLDIDMIELDSAPITRKEEVLKELRRAINGKL